MKLILVVILLLCGCTPTGVKNKYFYAEDKKSLKQAEKIILYELKKSIIKVDTIYRIKYVD